MKKGGGGQKGSEFERTICKQLSLWWTDGQLDDVFWRTSGSGARATTRAKVGKHTLTGTGDILAVNEIGAPLLQILTFELKRGYDWNIPSILTNKKNIFHSFWEQVTKSATLVPGSYPALLWKPDRVQPFIFFPKHLLRRINAFTGAIDFEYFVINLHHTSIVMCLFSDFLTLDKEVFKKLI